MPTLNSLAILLGFQVTGLNKVPKVDAIYNAFVNEDEDLATKLVDLRRIAEDNHIKCKPLPPAKDNHAHDDDEDDKGEQSLRAIIENIAQSPKEDIIRLLTKLAYHDPTSLLRP